MAVTMQEDYKNQDRILEEVLKEAKEFLAARDSAPVAPPWQPGNPQPLQAGGTGAAGALAAFKARFGGGLQVSSGPRFFGYVIGGITPAALAGDWLTSLYDQNAFGLPGTVDRYIELEAVEYIKDMLNLPNSFNGVFTSGATMANFTCLATAREWAAAKEGKTANDGIYGLTPPVVLTGVAHASVYKNLSMLGIGRAGVVKLPCEEGREAVKISAVEEYLKANTEKAVIVIANMGTVNSGDLDDLAALVEMKKKYGFYLHCEGAIGAVAAASPMYRPLFAGLGEVDSITVDCHKWLNTPYDGGVALINAGELQALQHRVFAQMETATDNPAEENAFYNMAPEGSRRFRALPAWFSLTAYGKAGYAAMVEKNCALARRMESHLAKSPNIILLHEVRLNIVSFTLNMPAGQCTPAAVGAFAAAVQKTGSTFLNTASLFSRPVVRCCISNWLTGEQDIDNVAKAILETAEVFCAGEA